MESVAHLDLTQYSPSENVTPNTYFVRHEILNSLLSYILQAQFDILLLVFCFLWMHKIIQFNHSLQRKP